MPCGDMVDLFPRANHGDAYSNSHRPGYVFNQAPQPTQSNEGGPLKGLIHELSSIK